VIRQIFLRKLVYNRLFDLLLDIINDLYNVFLMAQISMTRSRQRMTDREICEAVTISQATLYRYNGEIYKEDR
jgi:hypothetical protein